MGRARGALSLALAPALLLPSPAWAQGRAGPRPAASSPPAQQGAQGAQAPEALPKGSTPASDAAKEEARARFERGIALSDEEAWEAARVEFARSRELFPTRGNTKNLALCLRKLQRYDESLDVYEALLAEFPQLPPQDRAFVEKEVDELRKRVGELEIVTEPGASVHVGGRTRGAAPLPRPIRLSVGAHVVRVYKDGYLPFEGRVDVVGGQRTKLEAKLVALTQSGRLRVAEQGGKRVQVEIDHTVVGETPWEGTLPPGNHTVLLRGEGNLGTQPSTAPVQLNQLATITLAVEPLESELRIEPEPSGAEVAIDGVVVGRGLWVGRLRAGAHRVEVAAEGFLPERAELSLSAGASERLSPRLERDPSSPLWSRNEPPKLVLEAGLFGATGTAIGGEVTDGCGGGCSKGLPLGGGVMVRGGYELGVGLGFGVEVSYLALRQRVSGRAEALSPVGLPENPGEATDRLSFGGVGLGGAAWYRRGKPWGWEARLGAGALLGSMRDERSGDFETRTSRLPSGAPLAYSIGAVAESSAARFVYAALEVKATYRTGQHTEIGLGLRAVVLLALTQSSWGDKRPLLTGACGPLAEGCVTDGQARFGPKTTASQLTVLASPTFSFRAEF